MIPLVKIWGIPVKLHWSFFLVIGLIVYVSIARDLNIQQSLSFSLLVLILFICVLLHEMGHALTARRLGIAATDIILSPIGGLARLQPMDSQPRKEIIVAFAGPLVNLVIAFCLFIYLYLTDQPGLDFDPYAGLDFISLPALLYYMLFINVLLFLFNLLPAFPMDGGRILRALLSFRYDSLKATYIASVVGRIFAIGFLIIAVWQRQYGLFVISLFVYLMAIAEYQALKKKYHFLAHSEPESLMGGEDKKKAGPSFPPTNRPEEDLNT